MNGLPQINLEFISLATTAIERSKKGTMAMILKDAKEHGAHTVTSVTNIPKALSQENKEDIKRALMGYVEAPQKILLFVLSNESSDKLKKDDAPASTVEDGLVYFATQQFDYLVAGPAVTPSEVTTIASWVKTERKNNHTVKAVLPNSKSDYEGIINFTATELQGTTAKIVDGKEQLVPKEFKTEEYCSRIAGIILGTPMKMSCTYAPCPELTDIKRYTNEELDEKIDSGELVLFHDGEGVLIGRGVNSLVTTTENKGAPFQKIKILEVVDMVNNDIRRTIRRSYIGEYANSYDNKVVLITAIRAYFRELERLGILAENTSQMDLNEEKQRNYLESIGVKVEELSQQEIREANTDSKVFLKGNISILDAIEDVDIEISI